MKTLHVEGWRRVRLRLTLPEGLTAAQEQQIASDLAGDLLDRADARDYLRETLVDAGLDPAAVEPALDVIQIDECGPDKWVQIVESPPVHAPCDTDACDWVAEDGMPDLLYPHLLEKPE